MKVNPLFVSILIFIILITISFSSASNILEKTKISNDKFYDINLKYNIINPANLDFNIPHNLQSTKDSKVKLMQVDGPMKSDWIIKRQNEGMIFLSYIKDYT